jgi:hypothetical protein
VAALLGQERLQHVSADRTAIRPVDCDGLISQRPRATDCAADGRHARRHFTREDWRSPRLRKILDFPSGTLSAWGWMWDGRAPVS